MIAPCMGCDERTTECHATCTAYKAYRDRQDAINEQKWLAGEVERYESPAFRRNLKRKLSVKK